MADPKVAGRNSASSSSATATSSSSKGTQHSADESQNEMDQVYHFRVGMKYNKTISRELAIKGTSSLFELAETIVTRGFDFDMDHLFSFYPIGDYAFDCEGVSYVRSWELEDSSPDDMDGEKRIAENSYVRNVFKKGKKMNFLYDYGDSWDFTIECFAISEPETGKSYPMITKMKGKSPPQYNYD